MFKVLNSTNKENIIKIQGSKQVDSAPFASLQFQNYDEDTLKTYNMAAISCYDHFGNVESNGFGDIVFRTNGTGTSNLEERMRIMYNGDIIVGSSNSSNQGVKLFVGGNIEVASNITAPYIAVKRLEAVTRRLRFNGSNGPDSFITVEIDASNIVSGTLSQSVLPSSPTFSNVSTNTVQAISVSATKMNFVGQSNQITYSLSSLPSIYNFQDWNDYTPIITTVALSNIVVNQSRYRVINSNIDISFLLSITGSNNNTGTITVSTPNNFITQYNKFGVCPILENNDNTYINGLFVCASNNIQFRLPTLLTGSNYSLSCDISFEK